MSENKKNKDFILAPDETNQEVNEVVGQQGKKNTFGRKV